MNLIYPDYALANEILSRIWRCTQQFKGEEELCRQLNSVNKRIRFEPPDFPHYREAGIPGCTDPATGAIMFDTSLIRNVIDPRGRTMSQEWTTLTDVVLHELIHQRQHDSEPMEFEEYYKDRRARLGNPNWVYIMLVDRHEIPAHAYTDARRIKRTLESLNGTFDLTVATRMVHEANVHCPPALFHKEALRGCGVSEIETAHILQEYRSMTCGYLAEIHSEPEPQIFAP